MPQSITGAWRGFSLLKQADIKTAEPVDTLLYFSGDPAEPEANQFYVNSDEVTGELMPTKHRLLNRKLAVKHKGKGFPHVVGLFASMAMGKDTATQVGMTTAYNHKIEVDKTVVELSYRTMVENDGFAQFLYKGVACVGFQLSCQRDGFLEIEADLVGSASEATDATEKPDMVDESYLTYGDAKFFKGGAFDGAAVTGGTELSASMEDFTFSFKNNGKAVYICGDNSGQAGRVQRGQKYDMELKAKFELENQSHRTDFLAGTEFIGYIPLIGGVANGTAHYGVELIFPRIVYKAAKKGATDGTLDVAADFQVLSDPDHGPLVINVTNLQAASYLAAA